MSFHFFLTLTLLVAAKIQSQHRVICPDPHGPPLPSVSHRSHGPRRRHLEPGEENPDNPPLRAMSQRRLFNHSLRHVPNLPSEGCRFDPQQRAEHSGLVPFTSYFCSGALPAGSGDAAFGPAVDRDRQTVHWDHYVAVQSAGSVDRVTVSLLGREEEGELRGSVCSVQV